MNLSYPFANNYIGKDRYWMHDERYSSVRTLRNLHLRFFDVLCLARSFLCYFILFLQREKGPHELEMIWDFENDSLEDPIDVLPVSSPSCMSLRVDEKAEDPRYDVQGTNKMTSWRGQNDSRKGVSSGDIESWMSKKMTNCRISK